MIRTLVLLLVASQAFMPPGMCLCQIVGCGESTRAAKVPAPATPVAHTAASKACCSCSGCKRPICNWAPSSSAGQETTTKREFSVSHQCPDTTSSEPCSGCPVVSAGPDARTAITPTIEQILPDATVGLVVLTQASPNCRVGPREPLSNTAARLYIRYCTFLI